MEAMHIQKYLHTSPRKLRLMADMVRKLNPVKALDMLKFTQKAASEDMAKAIKTALGNAKQKGLDSTQLTFKNLEVNESMKMKRFRAGTRGRAKPNRKKMAHINIVLSDEIRVKNENLKKEKTISRGKEEVDDSAVKTKLTEEVKSESSKK